MLNQIRIICSLGCLSIGAILAVGVPANATVAINGLSTNGLSTNGQSLNGTSLNGLSTNGLSTNGLSSNGQGLNGQGLNGNLANSPSANGNGGHRTAATSVIVQNRTLPRAVSPGWGAVLTVSAVTLPSGERFTR